MKSIIITKLIGKDAECLKHCLLQDCGFKYNFREVEGRTVVEIVAVLRE